MEPMAQELDIQNYDLKAIQKLYNDANKNNTFLNQYTLLDVEDCKKKVFMQLMQKYDYKQPEYIQTFVDATAIELTNALFQNSNGHIPNSNNTQMVGVKNIIQDKRKMNPSYFQETYRIVNIDSMYRENVWQSNYEYDSRTSTNMTVQLNDPLENVVSLELTNVCIPFTFYNIDSAYGNNYFYIQETEDEDNIVKIEISGGNYTASTLTSAINDEITSALSTTTGAEVLFELDTLTNKIQVSNTTGTSYTLIFYDYLETDSDTNFSNQYTSNELGAQTQSKINNNLGWILGFRTIDTSNVSLEYTISATTGTIQAEALCFIPHTKYFIIAIDDLNKNQTNKGLVQISHDKQFIKPTTYFTGTDLSLNRQCLTNSTFDDYISSDNTGRKLTKNEVYSALQINNYRTNFNQKNSKLDANLINNVFGIIPFENKSLQWGTSIFTSDKNKFRRNYSGPVKISKLDIKLLDDKGNILNLNGSEWSFSMMSTHLYQH